LTVSVYGQVVSRGKDYNHVKRDGRGASSLP
jgi:hypothetical protein